MTVTEMTLQTCIWPWLCQIIMPDAVLKLMYFGSTMFLHHSQKCQKLYELNEFYSVQRWRWIKLTFPQNPDFVVLYSNFEQNQVTAPCNNCLAWHVLKDRSSVSILPFLLILMTLQRSVTEMTLIVGTRYFRQKLTKNVLTRSQLLFLTDLINWNT